MVWTSPKNGRRKIIKNSYEMAAIRKKEKGRSLLARMKKEWKKVQAPEDRNGSINGKRCGKLQIFMFI